jgi:uncharacterized membrane protein
MNELKVFAYLIVGTVVIALLASWALKSLGPPKK